jgi:hypothetical protein
LTFTLIENDSIIVNEDRLIRTLLRLRRKTKEGFICTDEYNMARLVGSRAAHLHGLSRLHKPNHQLQPVMPATKTVNYGLGKSSTNNSTQTDKMMVSFDVTSLYINVPLTFTIDYILDRIYPTCSCSWHKQPSTKPCIECTNRKDFEI